ncbi:MAG: hypothetical protein HND52_19640 [Ignavibacteriae bacterium]|nr:hypothetical protein [Ignavibacteriota bacterium]NOH00181.1 hypothetical protein [Ignavibacteriota bacterium]
MKRFRVLFFATCALLIFFGCTENNPIEPDVTKNDQPTEALEKRCRTNFTGTCNFVRDIDPGTTTVLPNGKTLIRGIKSEWYDEASDPRVTGTTIWHFSMLLNEDGTGKSWGTAELIVDDNGGKWKMWFRGKVTPEGGVAPVYGVGVDGDVRGSFAKWKYTMILANGFFYTTKGKIFQRR